MANIKVLKVNVDGHYQEHSEAADTIKAASFQTANNELTDAKLADLVGGGDASAQHDHASLYFGKTEYLSASAGVADAGAPVVLDTRGKVDPSLLVQTDIDHGSISGLADDDHTQYIRVDGTRAFTGDQSMGGHKITNLANATNNGDAINKSQLDAAVAGVTSGASGSYIPLTDKGAANGVATLDNAGLVPAAQLPSYVDDVLEFANLAALPATGEMGKIYVALDTNKTYRWSGSAYIYITSGAVDTVNGQTGVVVLSTDNISEGTTNLYWTDTRFDTRFDTDLALKTTNDLAEGSNLYFTDARAKTAAVADAIVDGVVDVAPSQNAVFDALALKADITYVDAQIVTVNGAIAAISYPTYTAAAAITKGDLVYVSSNGSVSKYATLTNGDEVVGIALATVASGATVSVAMIDTVLTGILSGATAGARYFWDGSALQTSMSTTSGANVWTVGVAKNATDLIVKVRHVRKNA
jgi:hypothetical protein